MPGADANTVACGRMQEANATRQCPPARPHLQFDVAVNVCIHIERGPVVSFQQEGPQLMVKHDIDPNDLESHGWTLLIQHS